MLLLVPVADPAEEDEGEVLAPASEMSLGTAVAKEDPQTEAAADASAEEALGPEEAEADTVAEAASASALKTTAEPQSLHTADGGIDEMKLATPSPLIMDIKFESVS